MSSSITSSSSKTTSDKSSIVLPVEVWPYSPCLLHKSNKQQDKNTYQRELDARSSIPAESSLSPWALYPLARASEIARYFGDRAFLGLPNEPPPIPAQE